MKVRFGKAFWITAGLLAAGAALFYSTQSKRLQDDPDNVNGPVYDVGWRQSLLSFLYSPRAAFRRYQLINKLKQQWRTPIEFYGKVIDESNQPIAMADAALRWSTSIEGASEKRVKTDSNGLFALTDARGFSLSVRVQKDGYYTSKSNETGFFYADPDRLFKPDRNNPVLFQLHKKRPAEPLVHVEFPGFARGYRLKDTGEPVEFDVLKGVEVRPGDGDVQIRFSATTPTNAVFDWQWSVSIPNGGILESTNEFDFEAPLEGYRPGHEITFSVSDPRWTGDLSKNYVVRLRNGMYGRISFRLLAYNGMFRFESFINPSGSRNLEYDPTLQTNQAASISPLQ